MTAPGSPRLSLAEDVQREFVMATRRYWSGPLYQAVVAAADQAGMPADPAALERALADVPAYQAFGWLEHHLQVFKYTGPAGLMPAAERQQQEIEAMLAGAARRHPERLRLEPGLCLPDYYRETDFHLVPGGIHSRVGDGLVYEWAAGSTTLMDQESVEVHDGIAAHIAAVAPRADVLDVGCGFGRTVNALARTMPGGSVTGCDLSAPALRLAHHRALEAGVFARFIQANGEDLAPFPDRSFDVVSATMFIHELPTEAVRAALRAARRVLRPGGRLVLLDFYLVPGGATGMFFHLGHARRNGEPFMPELLDIDLAAELRSAGFASPEISPYPTGAPSDRLPERWRLPWTLIEATVPEAGDA